MRKVVVYGAGGHARVIIDILEKEGVFQIAGLVDDRVDQGTLVYGYRVLGGGEALPRVLEAGVEAAIVAVGDNRVRAALMDRLSALGFELVSTVHPSSAIARGAKWGAGCVIMAQTVVSVGVRLGKGVVVGTASNVAHDSVIGDYVLISAGVHTAGRVQVGDFTLIGVGASIAPGIRIGENVVIGAGASVIDDVPDNVTVAGVPARVIRK